MCPLRTYMTPGLVFKSVNLNKWKCVKKICSHIRTICYQLNKKSDTSESGYKESNLEYINGL
ncbi:hypothetical protein KSS87_000015, partial [Heliosperma pusillum]